MKQQRISAAKIRLQKDLEEVNQTSDAVVTFPDPNDIMHFNLRIRPISGYWANHNFDFRFDISEDWPIEKPSITILTKVWHPNIDEEGNICLNIIKENYTPVLSISKIVATLYFLFIEPNPYSPLNNEAANQLINSPDDFKEKVEEYMEEYCSE